MEFLPQQIRFNSATAGGAISFHKKNPVVILSLINCTFIDNTAIERSRNRLGLPSIVENLIGYGAIIVRDGMRCIGSNFISNSTQVHGGVVHMSNFGSYPNYFYSESCIFTNNSALGGIGGVHHCRVRHTVAHIVESTFINNTALSCGVAYASVHFEDYHNNVTIESSLFMYNSTTDSQSGVGGVACVSYGTVSITCSRFNHNIAVQDGGVVYTNESTVNIVTSSFTNI